MFEKSVVVTNEVGLHARALATFVDKASLYNTDIWLQKDDRRVNAKSLLSVLSLGVMKGDTVKIIVVNDKDAADNLVETIKSL